MLYVPQTQQNVPLAFDPQLFMRLSFVPQLEQNLNLVSLDMPPDYYRTMKEIVENAGYVYQEKEVTTKDGYILTMVRVKKADLPKDAPVIMMQHGLFSSANNFVANHVEKAPAFIFANLGYDVWCGNNRGNMWSRKHTTLDPDTDSAQFFDYDFEKLGDFDLPAQIDAVREETGVEKLTYLGHSQGTSQMFYKLATDESFINDRVNLFVAFAPILRLGNIPNFALKHGVIALPVAEEAMYKLGIYEFFGPTWTNIREKVCGVVGFFCDFMQTEISKCSKYNDPERFLAQMKINPQGASWRELDHYGQEIYSNQFQKYDYGRIGNLKKYGHLSPPILDVTQIKDVPVAMFVGKNDPLGNTVDTQWARDNIKTTVHYQEIDNCDHSSFMLGKDTSYLKDVVEVVQKHNPVNKNYYLY